MGIFMVPIFLVGFILNVLSKDGKKILPKKLTENTQ